MGFPFFFQHTGEESIEQHRLLCKEAKSENGDLSKSQGLFSSQDKRTFDALFNKVSVRNSTHKMYHLKLHKNLQFQKKTLNQIILNQIVY